METTTLNANYLVTGVFDSKESADRAYEALQDRGYTSDKIHVIMSDDTRTRHYGNNEAVKVETGTKTMSGTGTGAAIGGTIGAVAAAIAAVGTTLLLPGLGLIVAGPLAAALAGAGAGGLTGGVIGALVGSGIPEEKAVIYERQVREGNIVIGVHARNMDEVREIEAELRLHHAHDVHS